MILSHFCDSKSNLSVVKYRWLCLLVQKMLQAFVAKYVIIKAEDTYVSCKIYRV